MAAAQACAAAGVLVVKRGASLRLEATLAGAGVPVDVSGWQVDCWLRAPGGRLVQALALVLTAPVAGRYRLSATPAQTATWPLGLLEADVRYADAAGRVLYSATFNLRVLEAVTTPAPAPATGGP